MHVGKKSKISCKNCRFARPNWWVFFPFFDQHAMWSFAKCHHPDSMQDLGIKDYHLGEEAIRKVSWQHCSTMRNPVDGRCGPDARLFKPKL